MKKTIALLVLCWWACSCADDDPNRLNASQLIQMMQSDSSVQLVDVRMPEEWAKTGTIEGALTIDFKNDDFESRIAQLSREQPVVVYCAAGKRSTKAARKMRDMGFKKVWVYKGGIDDWLETGHETVR